MEQSSNNVITCEAFRLYPLRMGLWNTHLSPRCILLKASPRPLNMPANRKVQVQLHLDAFPPKTYSLHQYSLAFMNFSVTQVFALWRRVISGEPLLSVLVQFQLRPFLFASLIRVFSVWIGAVPFVSPMLWLSIFISSHMSLCCRQ